MVVLRSARLIKPQTYFCSICLTSLHVPRCLTASLHSGMLVSAWHYEFLLYDAELICICHSSNWLLRCESSASQAYALILLMVSHRQRTDLTDGNWVFQVQALATSGVSGATVSFPFLVDSTAPIITEFIVGYTANNQAVNTSVASAGTAKVPTAAFEVYMTYSDGLLGSGVSNG
jgi:hypothetical protein